MIRYNKDKEEISSENRVELWGYNKYGNLQYFGYYNKTDFDKTSPEFKIAYQNFMNLFNESKTSEGFDKELKTKAYLKAVNILFSLEKKEKIIRHYLKSDLEMDLC